MSEIRMGLSVTAEAEVIKAKPAADVEPAEAEGDGQPECEA